MKLDRIRHLLGVDRAVAYTVLARIWGGLAGLVTLALVARHLSLAAQGYYYTFYSLVALQIIFELGFSTVILQLAAHEVAHLEIHPTGIITGEARPQRRLASVLQRAMRWYTIAALAMLAILLPAGIYFFHSHPQPGEPVAWLGPWCLTIVANTLTFQVDPLFSFMEGCGYVPQVARTRLWQGLLGVVLAWAALMTHHGLYAPAMMIFGQAIAGGGWLLTRLPFLRGLMTVRCAEDRIHWNEIWPFQWRIAISWLCGYFVYQLFTPAIFQFWGADAAGQMGMSLNIINAINATAFAWINTKAAPFGSLIAKRQFTALDSIFRRTLIQCAAFALFISAAVVAVDLYLSAHHLPFATRLLAPLPFALLMATPFINQIVNAEALYLRAHKQEKFLLVSVSSAVCISLTTYFLGKRFAAMGMVAGFLAVSVLISLTLGTYAFFKYRNLWHEV